MKIMKRLNCWEFKKCGREPGGNQSSEFGVCPASTESRLNGVHGETNSGRACWVIAGSMCNGKIQGTFAQKHKNCFICDFYLCVSQEESMNMVATSTLFMVMQSK
jgi:hypothetical protein